MNENLVYVFLICYLFGSFPTAFLMGKLIKKIDIRNYGSGNVGATNVFRVLGKKWGVVALFIDILKGSIAILISQLILGEDQTSWLLLSCLMIAIIGHLFPVWLKFKGGKGVAVAAGAFLVLKPLELGIVVLFFVLIVFITRYVSLGSILASILLPILIYLNLGHHTWTELYPYIIVSSITTIAIVVMHRNNISRLAKGTESKIFS